MFSHIIKNLKLVSNSQNTWKYHKIKLVETDTKLKIYFIIKTSWPVDWSTWIKCIKVFSWYSKRCLSSACTISLFNFFLVQLAQSVYLMFI